MIRPATKKDAKEILAIYNYYVRETTVSFEITPPSLAYMEKKIEGSLFPWLVLEEDGCVIGYAYATAWKSREAYRNSVETSIYLSKEHIGKGMGRTLYQALLNQLNEKGLHAIIGGISLPNEGSIRLHESLGFEKIAQFREVGFKFGKWIDVGYWQLVL